MKTEKIELAKLKLNEANPRQIREEKFGKLVESLLEQYDGLVGMSREEVAALLGGDTPGEQRVETRTYEGTTEQRALVYAAGGRPWAMFPEYLYVYLEDGRVTGARLVAD